MTTSTSKKTSNLLEFEGCNFLRARLVLATLTGRAVKIRNIRSKDHDPGLREFEAGLIRLFDKLTNGSKIEVSETGTALYFHPGILTGGKIEHDCSLDRGVGYYLEPLMALAPFCKQNLHVVLRGVTNNREDPSPDLLKASCMPILKKYYVVDDGLELKVQKRGAAPGGGGQVTFKAPVRKTLRAVQFKDQGKIKRIRGVAWATRVSPAVPNRMVEAAKGLLLKLLPDVYIYTDHFTGQQSGKSPGFGLVLTAETVTGAMLTAEVASKPAGHDLVKKEPTVPEDLAVEGVRALLEEIYRGGCVDSTAQSLILTFMAFSQQDVSKIVTGPLSTYTVNYLRHLKDFVGITFKLEDYKDAEEAELEMGGQNKVELTCLGTGYTNLSKRTT